ncbi:MAG: C-GCAxxG-C-C family protein [Candidatus Vecturithrix sp.]|jgi:C_GCAxxG_C_C family probable redox protein|nr:C-GCAxxG-C-C family protein [Candidatus Vecturithrix sp.]
MMKDHVSESVELFKSGFHCSQAVFAPFSEELGLPRVTAFKIACPFGGGLGGYGKTCGALTGGMMVLGLKYGTTQATDLEAKKRSREKTRELIEAFERAHGTSICNELVGFDRSNLSGTELMAKLPHFRATCPKFLETVVAFLEEEL